jgi:4-hydroxy-2-oxoheptanedioate aldolase
MNGIQLRQSLREGRRLYGTMVASTSPRWVPLLAGMPLDFVFIDTEHLPIDRHALSWMCQAYRYAGLAPVVRIASPDPYAACQVLDGGACAVKRRPIKGAKLAAALEGCIPFEPELERYVNAHNQAHSLIINIESVPAISDLDELLAVEGLDGVLIGPHDLSCSLGQPERYDTPEFEAAVIDIFTRARAAGVGAGIHSWMPVDREEAWCRAGANFIIHSSDIIATRDAISTEITALRTRMGDPKAAFDSGAGTV